MLRRLLPHLGALAVAAAALMMFPVPAGAQHHGGGGGHHDGGSWHGGGGGWHDGGRAWGWGGRGSGWGGYGWNWGSPYRYGYWWGGYPRYYSYNYYYPSYYGYYQPDYYSGPYDYDYGSAHAQPYGGMEYMSGYAGGMPADTSRAVSATVMLPNPSAELWIEGQQIDVRGTTERFVSPALDPGQSYTYTFRCRWTDNGRQFDRTKTFHVRAGDRLTVDFNNADEGERIGRPRGQ